MTSTDLEILHRDASFVAIAKPSGLAVHRGTARDATYALDQVRDLVGTYVHPVHRLDRATSGVLLFALEREGVAQLQARWDSVDKRYLALVRGVPPEQQLVDATLRRSIEKGTPVDDRVEARTEIRRLGVAEGRWGLVEARPLTGRTHQIRRHLKALSLPIVGDVRYGKGAVNRQFRDRFGLHRLALHAAVLRFESESGEAVRIVAPLPDDLERTLAGLALLEAARSRLDASAS